MENENFKVENKDNKENKKDIAKIIGDWSVGVLLVILLIVCYFFWGCIYDLPVTIVASVAVLAGTGLLQNQYKKIKKLKEGTLDATTVAADSTSSESANV